MPRLNQRRNVTAGVGGGACSVDTTVIGQGGSPGWFSDTVVVYGRVKGGREEAVVAYDTQTKQTTLVATGGGNEVKAGGNVWARWLGDGRTGLTTSTGFSAPQAGLLDVGLDGVLYYTPQRQTDHGITARYPNNTETVITTGPTALSLRGTYGGCVWSAPDGKCHVWNLPQPVTPNGVRIYSPRAAEVNGEWWLAYGDGRRILAQPFKEPVGYVVADLGNTFDLDALTVTGTFTVCYATTQGEQPGQWRTVSIDMTKPRVPLGSVPPKPQPPRPEPPMPAPIPNHLDVVKRARAKYNSTSGHERAGLIVNQVAWDLRGEGCGTFYKPSGDNWNKRSIDVIIYRHREGDPDGKGATFDILGDAEGRAEPQWGRTKPSGYGDEEKWRMPTEPSGVTPQPPEPTPEPEPPQPSSDVKEELTEIRNGLQLLTTRLSNVIADL